MLNIIDRAYISKFNINIKADVTIVSHDELKLMHFMGITMRGDDTGENRSWQIVATCDLQFNSVLTKSF